MLLSTLSGYTKCSNFTQVWRGTDSVTLKYNRFQDRLCKNHRGTKKENNLMESVRFGILHLILSFHGEEKKDKINQNGISSILLLHFAPGSFALISLSQPKSWAHGRHTNCFLTWSEFLKPCWQRQWEWRLWLSIISWNILENGQNPALWRLAHEVASCGWDFLFCFVF